METLLEVHQVAARLSLDPSTVRKMFRAKLLKGIRTGPALRSIRIYETCFLLEKMDGAQRKGE